MTVTVLGCGTWGTALSIVLRSAGHEVRLWSKFKEEVTELSEKRTHKNLPGSVIKEDVFITDDLGAAVSGAEVIILATPSPFIRTTAASLKEHLKEGQILVCVAKGIEASTCMTLSEVINDALGQSEDAPVNPVVALSGPTHAEEVAIGIPTLIVSASRDLKVAGIVQSLFLNTCIRPYTNFDIKGVELSGALKNIMALACGMARGLGYGDNTCAAIMTRGLAEITKLGVAMGCCKDTFSGLAGIGDLIVTSTSEHSRNNRAGKLIGQGLNAEDAKRLVGQVVEGINAIPAAMELSKKYDIELPIISMVDAIVAGRIEARDAVNLLFGRKVKSEVSMETDFLEKTER